MRYTSEIQISRPREKVVELFTDPANIEKWQPGFISMEMIEGEPGKEGSKCRMKYRMGKREVEMIETITKSNLPDEFSGTYEAKGVWNEVQNYFSIVDEHTTLYRSVNTFRFKGIMKLVALLMPRAFRNQSQKYLELFKNFAESQTD